MKNLLLLVILFANFGLKAQPEKALKFNQTADELLTQNVDAANGTVDYRTINTNATSLNSAMESAKTIQFDALKPKAREAYLINAYNLAVIDKVIDNYPVGSPMQVDGFFTAKTIELAGKKYSLNQIENELLRKEFEDGRLHFALVCGAVSCPKIYKGAFFEGNVDALLDRQTKQAVNDKTFVRVDDENKAVGISQIFRWYKEDFTKNGQSELGFINKYREDEIPADYKIKFYEYDWSLNANVIESSAGVRSSAEDGLSGLQSFTPSSLFGPGQWEFKTFSNLYTQTKTMKDFQKVGSGQRDNFYTNTIQFTVGINNQINIGYNLWSKGVLANQDSTSSPLDVLKVPGGSNYRSDIVFSGPSIRIAPFKSFSKFSLQSTLLLPVAEDMEGRLPTVDGNQITASPSFLFLEFDRSLWITDFYLDRPINDKLQAFFKLSAWYSVVRNSYRGNNFLETPISGFLSYFPNDKITIYAMTEYWAKHSEDQFDLAGNPNKFSPFSSYFIQSGLGGKYQVIPGLFEIEALYTNFWLGADGEGAGETFNLGFRLIH